MMKTALIQMDMAFAAPDENFAKAKALIRAAAAAGADTAVLPETWNTGFFPKEDLEALADRDLARVKEELGALAKELRINLVAGSVANVRDGRVYNTAAVFDRAGRLLAQYDKTHLFSPMGEHEWFEKGDHLARFTLDGLSCAVLICYDIRFPELTRTLALPGLDVLFLVAQWPSVRVPHLEALVTARAIENQMFVCCCNSCGKAGETVYGGHSFVADPLGVTLVRAGEKEETVCAGIDTAGLEGIRSSINVFRDRRPALYHTDQ